MTPNVPLFRKVMDWIEEQAQQPWQDREWDQGSWSDDIRSPDYQLDGYESASEEACGTTYCLAGYVAHLDGWTPNGSGGYLFKKDGQVKGAREIATKALGISRLQAESLFFFTINSPQHIREVIETKIVRERL